MTEGLSYRARCSWSGSTGAGYDDYERGHTVESPPATDSLDLSTDPEFRGRADRLNPEQLLVMAASSCQLLSFLATSARARIDVVSYEDDAEGFMPTDKQPIGFESIALRPRIVVMPGPSVERVAHLVEVAHEQCFIANSLRAEVTVEPQISFAGER